MVIKKFLVCICTIIFILLLSACSTKVDESVVVFATWGSQSEMEILKPILKEFESQNPNIHVELMHIPQNYFQKIHLLFASKTEPDVIFINNLNIPVYSNFLEDLSSIKNKADFVPQSLEALSVDGKLYAIPRDVSNLLIFYNKKIFDEKNVTYPNENWTLEEFLEKSKALTDNNYWAISFDETVFFYLPYIMAFDGGILTDKINSPQTKKAIEFYSDLRNKYHVAPKKADSASATMTQLFLQEKLAMHLCGRWIVPKYRSDANFSWGVINFPRGEFNSKTPLDASGWAISKNSKHKENALKLIEFLASNESSQKFVSSGLITPARIDVLESESFNSEIDKVFYSSIYNSQKTPVTKNYNEIIDALDKKLEPVFNP